MIYDEQSRCEVAMMRNKLRLIAEHPDSDMQTSRQAEEYMMYSDTGLWNYRMRIRKFINETFNN